MKTNSIVPSWGRDYKSKAAVLEAWNSFKDFRLEPQGQYVNKNQVHQLKEAGITHLNFRYKKLRNVFVLEL
jgi:hypothetical protein